MAIIERSTQSPKYIRYESYKRLLRLEFENRCCYCSIHEGEYHAGGIKSFCVEHFRPRSKYKHLECIYSNLYYACRHCNETKGDQWPSPKMEENGFRFLDPCVDDFQKNHFSIESDGSLKCHSKAAEYTKEHIRLDRAYLKTLRKLRRETSDKIDRVRKLLIELQSTQSVPSKAIEVIAEYLDELKTQHLHPPIPYELQDQH